MKTRPSDFVEENQEDMSEMEACAHDLMQAISEGSAKKVAETIQAMFELADSKPHVEGEHLESEGEE